MILPLPQLTKKTLLICCIHMMMWRHHLVRLCLHSTFVRHPRMIMCPSGILAHLHWCGGYRTYLGSFTILWATHDCRVNAPNTNAGKGLGRSASSLQMHTGNCFFRREKDLKLLPQLWERLGCSLAFSNLMILSRCTTAVNKCWDDRKVVPHKFQNRWANVCARLRSVLSDPYLVLQPVVEGLKKLKKVKRFKK